MNVLPSLDYRRRHRLIGQHTDSITALSFNPTGTLLASGGIDGRLCIWCTKTGQAIYLVIGTVGILSIEWINDNHIYAGMEDGVLLSVHYTKEALSVSGFGVHASPLECLAKTSNNGAEILLATGAHSEVHIWKARHDDSALLLQQTLPSPTSDGFGLNHQVLVTSLHWIRAHPNALIVSYLYHGIIIWDTVKANRIRTLPVTTAIGDTCLSRDQNSLAAYNISTGFDIYDLVSHLPPVKRLDIESNVKEGKLILPAKFIHRDTAILHGGSSGSIRLWDTKRDNAPLQVLTLPGDPVILAVDAHLNTKTERFLLAAGTAGEAMNTRIQIWEAQERHEQFVQQTIKKLTPVVRDALQSLPTSNTEGDRTLSLNAWSPYTGGAIVIVGIIFSFAVNHFVAH